MEQKKWTFNGLSLFRQLSTFYMIEWCNFSKWTSGGPKCYVNDIYWVVCICVSFMYCNHNDYWAVNKSFNKITMTKNKKHFFITNNFLFGLSIHESPYDEKNTIALLSALVFFLHFYQYDILFTPNVCDGIFRPWNNIWICICVFVLYILFSFECFYKSLHFIYSKCFPFACDLFLFRQKKPWCKAIKTHLIDTFWV